MTRALQARTMRDRWSHLALEGKRSLPIRYEKNASLGLGKGYSHRINFACADCEQPLVVGDKGSECLRCKRWPLCTSCNDQHGKSCRV
jgi:hypothetical protein